MSTRYEKPLLSLCLGLCLSGAVSSAAAQDSGSAPPHKAELQGPVERPMRGNVPGEPGIPAELMTEGFLAAHPDLRWRRQGLHQYANKRYDQAMEYFLRAARYADKPAQAMIAEMYWTGTGVTQDRALGYAWMDLAAERSYSNFIIKREEYWRTLDEAAQRDAIVRGQPLLAEYGDQVAKARMTQVLRKERSQTGSRVGFLSNMKIFPLTGPDGGLAGPKIGTGMTLNPDVYYAPKYWRPANYFEWQDQVWDAPAARKQRVRVGEVEQVGKPAG